MVRLMSIGVTVVVATTLSMAAQSPYLLMSAQVVAPTEAPPLLKLMASGPIAYDTLEANQAGEVAEAGRLIVRLYGVRPGPDLLLTGLAPYQVAATAVAHGCELTITAIGLPSEMVLIARAGQRANEIEVVAATLAR